ncbi:SusC/RagA family TonB-linked outer membrane protein [Chitinophaga horti]|uniref:SusC/RagA family TonB-linked outer membrane protein n=1 Tax=Chitinophaga horti TaxID=2920382 RepID=A0ABY6IXD7_9BACT|nr:SusC/RagA family TonB-linked outer membrane protein [Chitinophaga horti]UYQ91960.1 SusC/RagA family TonB-linked outer membrane protein [Chitinophaga horti]
MRQKLLGLFLMTVLQVTVAFAQDRKVTGRVTDATDGSGIPGTSVIIKGTNTGTLTDGNGNFTINVPAGKELLFRSIGFGEKTIAVGQSAVLNVSLTTQTGDLNEVVVVAYGKAKKESITGSVAGVTSKDIEKRPVSNPISVLEGAAPGIQVNNTTGQPGAGPDVRIRGFTSNSSSGANAPLYVIDGVPFAGNVADINPNDIESVTVLKDAASSALYGSRGSNGVIIMTTKRAKGADGSINVVVNQGVYTRGIKEYERLSPNEFMETMWTGYRNNLMSTNPTLYPNAAAAGAKASASLVSDYLLLNIYDKDATALFDANGKLVADARIKSGYLGDLDWYKDIERRGYRQDYTISGTARSKKSNLYYSLGYLDEKGYVTTTDYQRVTGRINADVQAKEWMKYGFNLAGSHQKTNSAPGNTGDANSFVNPFNFARGMAPIYPVHMHDVTTGEYLLDEQGNKQYDDGNGTRGQSVGRHATWENELNQDRTIRNTLQGQIFIDFKFLKDFNFTLKGDMNVRNSDNNSYSNALIGDGSGNNGRASSTNYRYKNYTAQQLLTWGKNFGVHHVDALVAHENYYENTNYLYAYKTNQTFPGQVDFSNFTQITSLDGYKLDYRTEGYLSRVRYNYDEKYYIDGSFRRDGSSRFYKDVRWGNFWSVGGGWLLSKENFFQPLANVVDYAKVRASYGEVGNDLAAGRYAWMDLYTLDQNGNAPALYKIQNPALDLIWETSNSITAAVEGRIFDRANFTVEYFDKRSQNLIYDINLPLSAGATSSTASSSIMTKNIGSISNKGLEVSFDVDVVKTKDWRWNVGANATWMTNKVVKLPEENRENGIVSGNYKLLENHSLYDFWTYQYAGVDQMTGNALYLADDERFDPTKTGEAWMAFLVPINGKNYTRNTTYAKRDWSGSAIPNMYGSFTSALTFKGVTLSGLFTYSVGGKTYDDSYLGLMTMSGSVGNLHKDILNAWDGVPEGMTETSANRIDPKGVPVVDFSRSNLNNAMSTRFLQDGSYFVIKNIALSYALPVSVIKRADLTSVRINAGVENLATFTKLQGMNPQQSWNGRSVSAFVTPRVFSVGVNIGL